MHHVINRTYFCSIGHRATSKLTPTVQTGVSEMENNIEHMIVKNKNKPVARTLKY